MKKESPLFAIVDIEATAGSIGTNEEMIQFACVLMQDGKVIEEFDTLVNPMRHIPIRIQKLTGISQKEVNHAPSFDEIAHIIKDLLEDAIFVAHNVAFDYQFLNEQFQAVGIEPLTTQAIDTVALAQIAFPRASYYNLQELTAYLDYDIAHAHNALDDARATAFLLDEIIQKLKHLPLVTLEQLVSLADQLIYDTKWLINYVFEEARDNPEDLQSNLLIDNGLAIIDPTLAIHAPYRSEQTDYPLTDFDKTNFFNRSFYLREHQGELMDHIHHYFHKEVSGEELAIEAPSGMGKSIGYLVPSILNEQRVVISTHTRTLQDQLLDEALPLLREVTDLNPEAIMIKGCEHYLSITRFKRALQEVRPEDTEAFICMQLLVWLTETETGDLNELGVHSLKKHPFWKKVLTQYVQLDDLPTHDFYPRLIEQAKRADIIITNHAHLIVDMNREKSVLPPYDHLIVDEAQHLTTVISSQAQLTFSKTELSRILKRLGERQAPNTMLFSLENFVERKWLKPYQLQAIESTKQLLYEEMTFLFHLFEPHIKDSVEDNGWVDVLLEKQEITNHEKAISRVKQTMEDLLYHLQEVYQTILKPEYEKNLSLSDRLEIELFFKVIDDLKTTYDIFRVIFVDFDKESLIWLEALSSSPKQSIRLKTLCQEMKNDMLDKLHRIKHVVYISSTLSVNRSVSFFKKQIKAKLLTYLEFQSPYQWQDQVKIMLPSEMKPVKKYSNKQLANQIANDVTILANGLDRKTLILFHSHDVLQGVFNKLVQSPLLDDYDILAQDLSGSRHKILKQFKQSKKSLLLGSDTFFEGIDLPGDLLEVVILTRLPFDSPDMPIVKNEHQQLKQTGMNVFMEDLLPRAIIKTKQAYGRLIRSEKDKGVFIVLDDRYLNASYSKLFQQSIPNGNHYEIIPIEEMSEAIQAFLSHE